jgi:neopullulanase
VFNHASRGLMQFNDILENEARSPYLDWFHVRRFPLNAYGGGDIGYDAWWNLPALPKFDTSTPAVREFLWQVGEYWLRQGIDGWRLDVPNEIDDDPFWREFRRRCRAVAPECYLVGEIWDGADRWLRGDQFDAVMNYPLARALFGFVGRRFAEAEIARSGYRRFVPIDAQAFASELGDLLTRYPEAIVRSQLNLLGSHDTPRALTMLAGDMDALRQLYLLLFTLPGAPCVYYGDEIGLEGGHDPACRQSMPWDHPEAFDTGLRGYVRHLAGLRRRHAALRRGIATVLAAQGRVFVMARQHGDERLVVVVNAGSKPAPMPSDAGLRGPYVDLLDGSRLELGGGEAVLRPRAGHVLAPPSGS